MQLHVDPYENFMLRHLRHYGLFSDQRAQVTNTVTLSQTWERDRDRDVTHPPRRDKNSPSSDDSDSDSQETCGVSRRPCSLPVEPVPRSRLLVLDPEQGVSVPKLREPQGLFSSLSLANLQQGVRWPVECQVIKEEIRHIEWEPPQPETFYQPTGHERTPLPVGKEKGKVVYLIEPATKTSYFTYARVGGGRGPIREPAGGRRDDALEFESRFESGNLQKAVQTGLHDYELTLRTDLYTDKHTQWFYFRVRNMEAGATYRFTIVNLMKPRSLYGLGLRPLLYSERAAAAGGVGWRRTGDDIKYYGNQAEREGGRALYSLTWTCRFPYEGDTCYFAHSYPYTYSDLRRFLASVTSDPVTAALCKVRVLCRSLAGNAVYVLTVTSPSGSREAARAKRAVVLTARVHPGETVSSWAMQGLLGYLLGDSADARLLRDAFVFKLVPMLNPDGVVVGNYRCSLAGRDPNRNYRTLLREAFPCVWHTRNMVKRVLAEREVVLFCDFHGHSRKNNVFVYGCESRGAGRPRFCERVFPLMMSKNAGNKFSYRSCKFRAQKSKEGTGRVVMWKLGIANSYTMESTFAGSTLGNRKGTHFSTQDLKSLGYHFCDTLLDFCDPDPAKVSTCLVELAAMRREALLRVGGDSGVSLSDDSASDLESSTSGSNSTDSNELPAHLLNIINKEASCKTKRLKTRKERTRLRQERALSHAPKISPLAFKHNAPAVPGEGRTENQGAAVSDCKRERKEFHLEAVTATCMHFEDPVDTTQPPDSRVEPDVGASRRFPLRPFTSQPRQPSRHRRLPPTPCGLDPEPSSTTRGKDPPPHAFARRSAVMKRLVECSLFPVFVSPLERQPTRPRCPAARPVHRPKAFQEARVELARVSITLNIPEASSTSADSMETVKKRWDKDGTSGAVSVKELDGNRGGFGPDSAVAKQATDTDPFLPNLRKQGLSADSRSRRLSPLSLTESGWVVHSFPKVPPAAGPAQALDPLSPSATGSRPALPSGGHPRSASDPLSPPETTRARPQRLRSLTLAQDVGLLPGDEL